jgi:hypothetical protein
LITPIIFGDEPQNTIAVHITVSALCCEEKFTLKSGERPLPKDTPKHGNLFGLIQPFLGNKFAYSDEVDSATMKAGPKDQCFSP